MTVTGFYAQLFAFTCGLQLWGAAAFSVPPIAFRTNPSSMLHATPAYKSSWDNMSRTAPMKRIEGKSRNTWDFGDIEREVVQIIMKTNGRPMNAEVQLWIGPDWTPFTLKVYSEDGLLFPVQLLVGTRNKSAQIEIRNTGPYEYPLSAACTYAEPPLSEIRKTIPETGKGRYIEGGGAVYSVPFGADAEQIQVLLNTETRQLKAKLELLNGPNNNKQTFEVFTNNGLLNSLYVVFNTTPRSANTVRIRNEAPLEFPCNAYVSKA